MSSIQRTYAVVGLGILTATLLLITLFIDTNASRAETVLRVMAIVCFYGINFAWLWRQLPRRN